MKHPTDDEITRAMAPYHEAFTTVARSAEDAHLMAIAILGLPRPVERAGDWHRAMRTKFRAWCDETNGLFRMVEEREGLGLDCIVCSVIAGKPFIIRFGRFDGQVVKRNATDRSRAARSHGMLSSAFLFDDMDELEPDELRQVTLAHTIEDEGTAAGRPKWFMGRLLLLVEHFDTVDILAEVARFNRPASIIDDVRRAVAEPRTEELELWRKQIRAAKRRSA